MILTNAPVNEAIVSNVGEIGEFRIRNSAKAFSILSSGLYANKIRAIIRELSCNACDSHTAAGRADTPFDVHLPNALEPFFSIRDYGTGLSHEQVTNIYTTYFESTKTDSNAFIGALGLGSKSPFSYTDNFTVTAIKDGVKGIYTAFINEAGVPSIALMTTEASDEPTGVEVKFAVDNRHDFHSFSEEARHVYTYFALRPVITGHENFYFRDVAYESRDIIPGVHQTNGNSRGSVAVMGNIAYPIDVPNADKALGELRSLLGCSLEIHFSIGELDFQASREGLSYIPQTVNAIKRKLEAVNAVLASKLAEEADAVENLWDRAVFLYERKKNNLWTAAVTEYATKHPIPTFVPNNYHGLATFKPPVKDLESKYNVQLRCVVKNRYSTTCNTRNAAVEYGNVKDANGNYETWHAWHISVDTTSHFVINDLKTGASERAKYHYRHTKTDVHSRTIYILDRADKTKAMDLDGFFAEIHNPPEANRFLASSLLEKPRAAGVGKDVTILKLERRKSSGYSYRRSDDDMVWRDAGKADSFDKKSTFYYVPLTGFQMISTKGYEDAKRFHSDVTSLPGLFTGEIYGVRKGDIEEIKKRKNWINLETHIEKVLNKRDNTKLLASLVRSRVEDYSFLDMPATVANLIVDPDSVFLKAIIPFKGVDKADGKEYNIISLLSKFAPTADLSPDKLVAKYNEQFREAARRYPLIAKINTYRVNASDIAEYINMCDTHKKGK